MLQCSKKRKQFSFSAAKLTLWLKDLDPKFLVLQPVDVGGESVPDIKKEKDEEIIEIPEAAGERWTFVTFFSFSRFLDQSSVWTDFSGFVLSPEWHEPPQPSPAPEPPEREVNPTEEEMKAQAMLSEPQMVCLSSHLLFCCFGKKLTGFCCVFAYP